MQLEISGITKCYGKKQVIDNFSLTVENGVCGLLGPNGAGKTTLMGIITGLITADKGYVRYIDDNGRSLAAALGYLPQYQNFYGNFTAKEMLMYFIELKDYCCENIDKYVFELLESVNLADVSEKKIKTFSGGMKQRLGIAQALIGDPGIVIFDEPTAGLDPKERIRFRNIVSSIGKDRIVILATHIVTDVAYIASKVVLLDKGTLIFSGNQKELVDKCRGKVWELNCRSEDIPELMNKYKISNIIADEENFSVRIVSDMKPFKTATHTVPSLDDVCLYYFGEM